MNSNTEMNTTITLTAGSRNEEGFINSLNRQGFSQTKCGMEIIANSIDAYADNILFCITSTNILVCDDGIGMTSEKLRHMFDANRENHYGDKSMGVSGIGGIISNYQLSKSDKGEPREVIVYTKNKNDIYLKAVVPWDIIDITKKYDNTINIFPMNEIEIEQFDYERQRQNFANKTGTTIQFQYSETFKELLYSQFISLENNGTNLDNWWTMIFGKTQTNILLDKCDGLELTKLKKYDYFSGRDTEFYCGVFNWVIYFIIDNGKERFVTQNPNNPDRYLEIIQNGNGFSTAPKEITISPIKIENAQIINFTSGLRKDNRVFNPENPLNQGTSSATFYLNSYDSLYMSDVRQKDIIKEFCSNISVIRNNQKITGFPLEGCSVGSARANGDLLIKRVLHRCEVSYDTFSKQENKFDNIHRIQQNKHQNQKDFPIPYIRLIKYLKEYHYSKIMNYFDDVKELVKNRLNEEKIRKKAEQEKIKAEEERKQAVLKEEENKRKIAADALLKQQEYKEETSNEEKVSSEEEEKSSEEEKVSSEEEEVSSKEEEEVSSEEEEVTSEEEYKLNEEEKSNEETKEYTNKIIAESREWQKQAAQALMENLAENSYNKINGKEIYDFVMQYINKN
jgi:hypothetical protein